MSGKRITRLLNLEGSIGFESRRPKRLDALSVFKEFLSYLI